MWTSLKKKVDKKIKCEKMKILINYILLHVGPTLGPKNQNKGGTETFMYTLTVHDGFFSLKPKWKKKKKKNTYFSFKTTLLKSKDEKK